MLKNFLKKLTAVIYITLEQNLCHFCMKGDTFEISFVYFVYQTELVSVQYFMLKIIFCQGYKI